jgi:hypothetical protein
MGAFLKVCFRLLGVEEGSRQQGPFALAGEAVLSFGMKSCRVLPRVTFYRTDSNWATQLDASKVETFHRGRANKPAPPRASSFG